MQGKFSISSHRWLDCNPHASKCWGRGLWGCRTSKGPPESLPGSGAGPRALPLPAFLVWLRTRALEPKAATLTGGRMRQSAGPRPGLCRRRWAGASALDMLAGDGGAAGPGPPLESGGLRGPRARPHPAGQRPQRGERKAGRPESTDSHPTSSVQRLPFCVTAHPGVTPPAHAVWAPESTPRPQTPRGWGQVGCPTQPRPRPALVPNARAPPVRAAAPVSNVPCACLGSRVTGTR